jgi:tetratricopeptide (TPR) repeat protein
MFVLKDIPQAQEAYTVALAIFEQLENDWGRALCFFGLATITASAGQMKDACRLMQSTLEIYQRLGNMSRVIETRSILGEFYASLGQVEQASQYFIANRDFLEEVGAHERSQGFRERLERLGWKEQGTPAPRRTS